MFDWFAEQERTHIRAGETPAHVAIIMDGNGTWAKRRGLPRTAGHAKGASSLRKAIAESARIGIKYLSVFAFSTENWKRPKKEVDYLMDLFMQSLHKEVPALIKNKIYIQFLGDLSKFTPELRAKMQDASKQTSHYTPRLTLNVMVNYGSRDEILRALKKAHDKKITITTEADLSALLDTAGMPDPDLLIRTSHQIRISNFMLWQLSYAELYFTPVCWPDFSERELRKAIREYQKRQRRHGGL